MCTGCTFTVCQYSQYSQYCCCAFFFEGGGIELFKQKTLINFGFTLPELLAVLLLAYEY